MSPSHASSVRLSLLALALALVSVLAMGCEQRWRYGDRGHPNIILIVVDTLRADHLGTYGYHRDTSPNLDLLAERAAVFDRAYSHSPWTMPSVASILTGLEPRDHGISEWGDPLGPQLLTLPEVLQSHGYRTGAGVSHYILKPDYHYDQGFEFYDTSALDLGSPHRKISSAVVTRIGLQMTRLARRQPFFVLLHYFDPHAEYLEHPNFHFGDAPVDLYDGEIAFTDHHLGHLFERLADRGQLEHTIVAVVADHGEGFGDHGYRMHTIALYDELIRIPMLIYVPGFEPRRLDQVVAETQLAPTLLALAGLPIPSSFSAPPIPFDERGFLPADDRQVHAETREKAEQDAVIDGDWKLIHDRKGHRWRLYDLASDPQESENLRAEQKQRLQGLKGEIRAHAAVPRAEVESVALNSDTEEALRALGYLGDDEEESPQVEDDGLTPEPTDGDAEAPGTQ